MPSVGVTDKRHHAASYLAVLAVAFVTLPGCSKDPNSPQALTGTVTLAGQPLDEGSIQFLPTAPGAAGHWGARIANGRYELSRQQGLPPGTYRVVISSALPDKSQPLSPDQLGKEHPKRLATLPKERIPAEYNSNSRLTVDVRSDQENTFDFAIP